MRIVASYRAPGGRSTVVRAAATLAVVVGMTAGGSAHGQPTSDGDHVTVSSARASHEVTAAPELAAAVAPRSDAGAACASDQIAELGPIALLAPPRPPMGLPDVVVDAEGAATTVFSYRFAENTQGLVAADLNNGDVERTTVETGDDSWVWLGTIEFGNALGIDDQGNQSMVYVATELLGPDDGPSNASRVMVANRPAGGTWQPATAVTPGAHFIDHAQLAMNGAGAAIVAWNRNVHRSYAAYRPTFDAPWSRPHLLSRQNWFIDVGIDDAGNALVATFPNGLEVNRRLADAGWTQPVVLTRRSATAQSVAVSGDGTAYVSWAKPVSDRRVTHVAAQMTPDGVWHPAKRIGVGLGFPHSDLTVDGHGRALLAWWNVPGYNLEPSRGDVLISRSRPNGTWRQPTTLARAQRTTAWPQVQAQRNARGDSYVVWNTRARRAPLLKANYRPAGGTWTTAQRVTTRTARPHLYATAVGANGHAATAWTRSGRVWARTLTPCTQ